MNNSVLACQAIGKCFQGILRILRILPPPFPAPLFGSDGALRTNMAIAAEDSIVNTGSLTSLVSTLHYM